MEISFRNDGAFNEYAINAPVLVGITPIGRIRVVSEYTVVCEIFDMFVGREESIPTSTASPPRVAAVYIETDQGF